MTFKSPVLAVILFLGSVAVAEAQASRTWVSAVNNGGSGVATSGTAAGIIMSNSAIMSNGQGINTSAGGTVYSFGNNKIIANGTNGAPTIDLSLQ